MPIAPGTRLGVESAQLRCPDDGDDDLRSNGGCLAITGGLMMRTFTANSALHTDANNSGFHYLGNVDRCQSSTNRPPFFPLTNRMQVERTIEVAPVDANTPAKVRTLLMRLKGRTL